jgi:hypothetical protein
LNPNYVVIVKQDLDKLFIVGFIKSVEEVTWLSPIVVVPKKNGKLKIYVNFKKLNTTTMKDLYSLPFTDEVVKFCTFLNGFLRYHQISITPKKPTQNRFCDKLGAFVWVMMPFGVKNGPPTYESVVTKAFGEYIDVFMNIILSSKS